jgi:hypothetical protein
VATLPPGGVFAGTWNVEGVILLGSENNPAGPLLRVMAGGGTPMPETELDASRKETAHAYPHFLPDGRHYFYLARGSDPQNPFATYIGELDSKERRPLTGIASEVLYSPTGHILFIRDGALMAQPFDVNGLELAGDPFPLADAFVAQRAVAGNFSVSSDGRVAYFKSSAPGGATGNTQLAWRDRSGSRGGAVGPEGEYQGPELSWDGKYVAFARGTPGNIWILDIARNLVEPLTNDPADDRNPRWSPDGKTIAFQSSREGGDNLYVRAVGVVGEDKPVLKDQTAKVLSDWSPDGKYLAYTADGDVWALPMSAEAKPGEGKSIRVTQTPSIEITPRISPDGRWIAYVSNEPGQNEVYIQAFPAPGGLRQKVSTIGGLQPRWGRDSKELFYYQNSSPTGWMRVSIDPRGSPTAGAPEQLFIRFNSVATVSYSVGADGRFLMQQSPGTGGRGGPSSGGMGFINRIVVLLHWDQRGSKTP